PRLAIESRFRTGEPARSTRDWIAGDHEPRIDKRRVCAQREPWPRCCFDEDLGAVAAAAIAERVDARDVIEDRLAIDPRREPGHADSSALPATFAAELERI